MTFDEYLDVRGVYLARLAQVLCDQRELAEDVLQEVLIRVNAQWARIEPMERRDAYIRRMLVNEHLSWRRRAAARQILFDEITPPGIVADPADRSADYAEVSALLDLLPRRQRTAVVLRYYSDLTDNEIAEAMGCSGGAVRSYLSRALATMRVDLATHSLEAQKG